ncbi:flagellar brake protein [Gemmatimonadota bacterium]
MDESLGSVLKYLEYRGPDPAQIRLVIYSLAVYFGLILVTVLVYGYLRRRRERKTLLNAARSRGLSNGELKLITHLAGKRSKINVKQVFKSVREFHRLFGPMMHELVASSEIDVQARKKLDGIFALRKKLFGDVSYHFGNMTSTIQLRIGLKVLLRFEFEGVSHTFSTVVLDVDSEAITVANPSKDGSYFMFDRGQKFKGSFNRPEDGLYEFSTHALRAVSRESQYFLLLAHADQIERMQSRMYYRIPLRVELEFDRFAWNSNPEQRYHGGVSEAGEQMSGLVVNLGGGGVLIRTAGELHKDDMITFDLPLPGGAELSDVLGKVVEVEKSDGEEQNYHVQFLNLKQSDKDTIIKSIQQHNLPPES